MNGKWIIEGVEWSELPSCTREFINFFLHWLVACLFGMFILILIQFARNVALGGLVMRFLRFGKQIMVRKQGYGYLKESLALPISLCNLELKKETKSEGKLLNF